MKMSKLNYFLLILASAFMVACGGGDNKDKNDGGDAANNTTNTNNGSDADKTKGPESLENSNKKFTIDLANKTVGLISATSTEAQLVEAYGSDNVISESGMNEMSGEMEHMTWIFKTGEHTAKINWTSENFDKIISVDIYGSNKWKTTDGLGCQSTLKDVETVNGKPFKVTGLSGSEASGDVMSWEGGKLANSGFIPKFGSTSGDVPPAVDNDEEFMSNMPDMASANPQIDFLTIYFGE